MKMKTDDVELYCESHGKGRPIVFSHAWLDDCSIWDSQIEHLSKDYAVILYDHRGHGMSGKPKEGNYSVQALSNDMYSLIRKLELEKPIIVGFSLGGMAAILLALKHSDEISRLVLVGATAKMTLPASARFLGTLRVFLPYEAFLRMMCKYRFYKPSRQIVDEELVRASKVDKSVAFECWKELTENYDVRDEVSKIKVPTLIIVSEKDKVNLEASRHLNRLIKDSELRIVRECGHTVMIEKPQEFNQILEDFVKQT